MVVLVAALPHSSHGSPLRAAPLAHCVMPKATQNNTCPICANIGCQHCNTYTLTHLQHIVCKDTQCSRECSAYERSTKGSDGYGINGQRVKVYECSAIWSDKLAVNETLVFTVDMCILLRTHWSGSSGTWTPCTSRCWESRWPWGCSSGGSLSIARRVTVLLCHSPRSNTL